MGTALETHRLYKGVERAVRWETRAADGYRTKRLTLTKSANLPDVVVWNVNAYDGL